MKNLSIFLFSLLLSFSLPAEKLTVTVTVGMIGSLVERIAGEEADVVTIIGSDVDPHLYRPTRNDVVKMQKADLIFYNGMMLEGKMGEVLQRMSRKGKPVVAVTEELQQKDGYALNKAEGGLDPHVWMDVQGWIAAAEVILESLVEAKPSETKTFTANAEDLREELELLEAYAKTTLATIPENRRVLVTAHDAFGYMGRAYGLEVKGIQGLSTESEAGIKDIENLISYLVETGVPAVFVESSVADKNVRALVEGCRAKDHPVKIGGELFSDAMGKPGTYEGTYIGMIDHNVTTITRALGGEAPEKGMQGKLGQGDGE